MNLKNWVINSQIFSDKELKFILAPKRFNRNKNYAYVLRHRIKKKLSDLENIVWHLNNTADERDFKVISGLLILYDSLKDLLESKYAHLLK